MSGNQLALIELLLVFGLVLGFAVWQLIAVRRSQREDRRRAEAERSGAADAPDDGRA